MAQRVKTGQGIKATPPEGMVFTGVCACGCGEKTRIATRSRCSTSKRGPQWVGYPLRFINTHFQRSENRTAEKAWAWKGGRMRQTQGYIQLVRRDRTKGQKTRYVLEHRLVMEQMLGRKLLPVETVHHRNGVRDDNRPENLELFTRAHFHGQRVIDAVKWAKELLALYPHL